MFEATSLCPYFVFISSYSYSRAFDSTRHTWAHGACMSSFWQLTCHTLTVMLRLILHVACFYLVSDWSLRSPMAPVRKPVSVHVTWITESDFSSFICIFKRQTLWVFIFMLTVANDKQSRTEILVQIVPKIYKSSPCALSDSDFLTFVLSESSTTHARHSRIWPIFRRNLERFLPVSWIMILE